MLELYKDWADLFYVDGQHLSPTDVVQWRKLGVAGWKFAPPYLSLASRCRAGYGRVVL